MARSVRHTRDFDRILRLPRRKLSRKRGLRLVRELTARLVTPRGAREGVKLNWKQAIAIHEFFECDGLYAMLPVGTGKTLLALALAVLSGAKRPVMCLPGGLIEQVRDMWAKYSRQWKLPRVHVELISFQDLASKEKLTLLERIAPDLVMIDEADDLRNHEAAAVVRLDRYRIAHWSDGVRFAIFTGTPGRLSIMDLAHHLVWALRDRAPVPLDLEHECREWAAALDEKGGRTANDHKGVGALRLLRGEGLTRKHAAQDGFRQLLHETPGVVFVDEDSCDKALHIQQVLCTARDRAIEKAMKRLAVEGETPSEMVPSTTLEEARLYVTEGVGFFDDWDPAPPEEWRDAHKAWFKFCLRKIRRTRHKRRPLDTPGAVAARYPRSPKLRAWKEIAPTFDPKAHRRTSWISASVVDFVAQWGRENGPAVIFCADVEFASALGRATGWEVFGSGGKSKRGRYVGDTKSTETIIVRIGSNLRGRNLQHFKSALFVNLPSTGRYVEQVFGRLHRQGQRDDVTLHVLIASGANADAFEQAIGEAGFGKRTFGVTQKVKRASIGRVRTPEKGYRWARRTPNPLRDNVELPLRARKSGAKITRRGEIAA